MVAEHRQPEAVQDGDAQHCPATHGEDSVVL